MRYSLKKIIRYLTSKDNGDTCNAITFIIIVTFL